MYSNRKPFTVSNTKGPQRIGATKKKASKPVSYEDSIIEEPAKIEEAEEINLIIDEPKAEEVVEEPTNGDN